MFFLILLFFPGMVSCSAQNAQPQIQITHTVPSSSTIWHEHNLYYNDQHIGILQWDPTDTSLELTPEHYYIAPSIDLLYIHPDHRKRGALGKHYNHAHDLLEHAFIEMQKRGYLGASIIDAPFEYHNNSIGNQMIYFSEHPSQESIMRSAKLKKFYVQQGFQETKDKEGFKILAFAFHAPKALQKRIAHSIIQRIPNTLA